MTPHTHDIRCGDCYTQLAISGIRGDLGNGPRTSTTLTFSCPACQKAAEAVVPMGIEVTSVQIVYYQPVPAKPTTKGLKSSSAPISARDQTWPATPASTAGVTRRQSGRARS